MEFYIIIFTIILLAFLLILLNLINCIKHPPILTNHARERFFERLNVKKESRQKAIMKRAFIFGTTKLTATNRLRATLKHKEHNHKDTKAVYYFGTIFIFTKKEHILKTLYKYK